jgi:hypothetical protein
VVAQSRQRPRSVKRIASALRSLLVFLHVDGVIGASLDLYGIAAVLATPLSYDVIGPLAGWTPATTAAVQVTVLSLAPVAFAAGMLRGAFARTGEIHELGAWLGADAACRPPLDRALAQALGDDSVQVAYWVPGQDGYAGPDGRPLALPGPGSGRAAAEISLDGRRVGAIGYDARLTADPELVQAAGRVAAIAMDRQRLTAELLASQEALRESRARLVGFVDLIPSTSWFTNVRSAVSDRDWYRIRKAIYRRAGHRCEACGIRADKQRGQRLEAHERFVYQVLPEVTSGVQVLRRLICRCSACHQVTHFGHTSLAGEQARQAALAHLMFVTGMDTRQARAHVTGAFWVWDERSQRTWAVDLSVIENAGIAIGQAQTGRHGMGIMIAAVGGTLGVVGLVVLAFCLNHRATPAQRGRPAQGQSGRHLGDRCQCGNGNCSTCLVAAAVQAANHSPRPTGMPLAFRAHPGRPRKSQNDLPKAR